MDYLDSAVLVAALANESMAEPVREWLDLHREGQLAISNWVVTEVSSALSIKVRTGAIDVFQRAAALAAFRRMVASSLLLLPVSQSAFVAAAAFADRHELNLRAGDALHLAIAAEHGATVYTLDRRMARAGPELQIPTHLIE